MKDNSLLTQYLRHLKKRKLGFWHRSLLKNQIRPFLRWLSLQGLRLEQLTPHHVLDYLHDRQSRGIKPATLRKALNVLRDFLQHFAIPEGLIPGDPTAGIRPSRLALSRHMLAYGGPLRTLFNDPIALGKYQLPLFAPAWEPYLQHLLGQRYAKRSLLPRLAHLFHFHQFLLARKVHTLHRITHRHLADHLGHQARTFSKEHGFSMPISYQQQVRGHLERFLIYAFAQRNQSFFKPKRLHNSSLFPNRWLDDYERFCDIHKGLAPATRAGYRTLLLQLRSFLERRHVHHLGKLASTHLDAFLLGQAKRLRPRSIQTLATALRSFFGYLHLQGKTSANLAQGLWPPSLFQQDRRPKYLPWPEVEQILASIDRRTTLGKRDYAILSLLSRHGLRAQEVRKLRLDDVDWAGHALTLRDRKNGDTAKIPLLPQIEQALCDYRAVRPPIGAPEMFVTALAPLQPLKSIPAVAVRYLARHPTHPDIPKGSHTLRHSFAKALIDRGARLHEVGALLGHRSLRSTQIYTRIDTEGLREVADNYATWLVGDS